jgi:multiple sugar transport system substrate-binding protein
VETEPALWDGYWSKLATQLAGGDAPDVMQQDYTYIEQYNARNQLVDLYEYAEKGLIDLSDWSDSALSSGVIDGKLIAISLGTNAWGMGVDPAVLARAGVTIDDTAWTWADYERIALAVFQATGVQTMPAGPQEFYQTFEHIVRQFGVPQFAAGGKSLGWTNNAAATAAVKEWFDIQLRLKAAGALYDPQDAYVMGKAMEEYPLSQGRTWNNFHWSNQHIGYLTAANRPLEYYMFPTVNGNKAPFGTYLKPSQFISMLSSSENKDLAARFVNFIINDLEANRVLLAERGIPVPASVRNDLSSRVDPNMKYLFDFIGKATPFTSPIDPPDPASAGEVYDTMRPIVLRCLLGEISSADAVAQIIQGANAVLSR